MIRSSQVCICLFYLDFMNTWGCHSQPIDNSLIIGQIYRSGRSRFKLNTGGVLLVSSGISGFILVSSGISGVLLVSSGIGGVLLVSSGISGVLLVSSGISGVLLVSSGISGVLLVSSGPYRHYPSRGSIPHQGTNEKFTFVNSFQ